jgi:hypothetical protein
MTKPTVICLVPVKNEAWILERFLKCAGLWADHIIIADQCSDDGSREITRKYSKVILLDNATEGFNEHVRQTLLLEAARELPGPRLLVSLDADEILSASWMTSEEWRAIIDAPAGTVGTLRWANVRSDFQTYWDGPAFPRLLMDDGTPYQGTDMHGPHIPFPPHATVIHLEEIRVLHYQYTSWTRMRHKHRWYQCWERLMHPERRPIDIYRQYHHMNTIPEDAYKPLPTEWFDGYERQGIDMTSVQDEPVYWWDKEVLRWFEEYGTGHFRRESVWDIDWTVLAQLASPSGNGKMFQDPRRPFDKLVHRWLRRSQSSPGRLENRLVNKALRLLGW